MTDKRPRPPLDGSAYKGFAAGAGDRADRRPEPPRPRIPNYPIAEVQRRRRRRSGGAVIAAALLGAAGLGAAGLLGYVYLNTEPSEPTAAPGPSQTQPAPAPRMEAALRAGPPPGVETAALPRAQAISPQPAISAPPAPAPALEARDDAVATEPAARARAARPARRGCEARAAGIERLLCRNPSLAALDRELNETYAGTIRSGAPVGQIAEEHEAWVIRRDRAAREAPDTVADLYQERIARLKQEARSVR